MYTFVDGGSDSVGHDDDVRGAVAGGDIAGRKLEYGTEGVYAVRRDTGERCDTVSGS